MCSRSHQCQLTNPKRGNGNDLRTRQQTHQPFFPDRWKIGQQSCRGKRKTMPQATPTAMRKCQCVKTRLTPRVHSPSQICPAKWTPTHATSRKETPRPSSLLDRAHLRRPLITVEETRWLLAHRMNQYHLQKCRAQERSFTQPRQEVLGREEGKPSVVSPADGAEGRQTLSNREQETF